MTRARYWWLTKDGDVDCLRLYEKHYSCYRYADGRKRRLFVGPGEKVVLRTETGDAMFVWRKFIDDSGQQGINCAVFRNESAIKSSELIRQADEIADCLWPHSRHYTYVDSERVASKNPGFCFQRAGWRKCGRTKGGLLVMERIAADKVDEITTLRAKVAELEADAERYRLLRQKVCIISKGENAEFQIINLRPFYIAPRPDIELDAVLDAVMAQESK